MQMSSHGINGFPCAVLEDTHLSASRGMESFYDTRTSAKHLSKGHSIPKGDKNDFVTLCRGAMVCPEHTPAGAGSAGCWNGAGKKQGERGLRCCSLN